MWASVRFTMIELTSTCTHIYDPKTTCTVDQSGHIGCSCCAKMTVRGKDVFFFFFCSSFIWELLEPASLCLIMFLNFAKAERAIFLSVHIGYTCSLQMFFSFIERCLDMIIEIHLEPCKRDKCSLT